MDPETPSGVATVTETSGDAPAENMSLAGLAATLGSRRGKTAKAAPQNQPKPENQPASKTPAAPSGESPAPETDIENSEAADPGGSATGEEPQGDAPEAEPTAEDPSGSATGEEPQGDAPAEVEGEIEAAEREATQEKPKAVQDLQKRVHKLVDERDTLSRENQDLRSQLTTAQAAVAGKAPKGGDLVAGAPEMQRITGEIANVDHWIDQIDANPDGLELEDGRGGKVAYTAQDLRRLGRQLHDKRQELVAEKANLRSELTTQFNQAKAEADAVAAQAYPWLKNERSPEYQQLQAMLGNMPDVQRFPNHRLAIADMLAGRALREAKAKAAAGNGVVKKPLPGAAMVKPPGSKIPPKVPAVAGNGAAKIDPAGKKVREAEEEFEKTGSVRDLAKSFSARRSAAVGR